MMTDTSVPADEPLETAPTPAATVAPAPEGAQPLVEHPTAVPGLVTPVDGWEHSGVFTTSVLGYVNNVDSHVATPPDSDAYTVAAFAKVRAALIALGPNPAAPAEDLRVSWGIRVGYPAENFGVFLYHGNP